MVTAVFENGSDSCTVPGLWQYDYGQKLMIQGLILPAAVEIQFSLQETGGETTPRVGVTKDGVTVAPIPDSMIENDGATRNYSIYAFIYLTTEDSGKTIKKITMLVKSRPKPHAFDTPEEADLFREAIAAVNDSAGRAETAEKSAEAWAHGHEEYPERDEDNAAYYAGVAKENSSKTSEDLSETQRLVESMAGSEGRVSENLKKVEEYTSQAATSASKAALSEQSADSSRISAENAQAGAEAAEDQATLAAEYAAASKSAAELAKTEAQKSAAQASADKEEVTSMKNAFSVTYEQAVKNVNNAGSTQIKNVNDAGTVQVKAVEDTGAAQATELQKYKGVKVSSTEPTEEAVEVWINPEAEEEYQMPEIKDDEENEVDTWSSKKIAGEIGGLKGDLADLEADTNTYSKTNLIEGIEWNDGFWVINSNTNTVQINPLGDFSYGIVDVSNYKDKRKIHATVSSFHSNVSMFLLVNAEGKVVALSGAGVIDKEMNVDDSVTKVYINKYGSKVPSVEFVSYIDVKEKLSELNTAFSDLDENKLSQSDIAIVTGDDTFSNLELGKLVTGFLTKSGGNGGDYNNDKQTDYISIKPNTYYKWDSYVSDARCAYVLFDENKNVISYREGSYYAGRKVYSITFNSGNAVYAKFGAEAYNTYGLTITELCADSIRGLDNRLRIAESAISDIEDFEPFAMFNKILCVGDSRTAGTYDYPNSQYVVNADYSICNMLAKMTGNTVLNAGSGGATCKTYWENKPTVFSTCENADAVFIWLGVNDIFKGTFDGTVADVSKTTYPNYNDFPNTSCGCLGKIIEFVKEKNPTATIYLCTLDQEFDPASDFRKNEISANALISQIATELGCVLIDLYNDSILKYKSGRNLYWGIEGCHMTTLGYNRVAKIYKNALANNKKKYVGVSVT